MNFAKTYAVNSWFYTLLPILVIFHATVYVMFTLIYPPSFEISVAKLLHPEILLAGALILVLSATAGRAEYLGFHYHKYARSKFVNTISVCTSITGICVVVILSANVAVGLSYLVWVIYGHWFSKLAALEY